MGGGGVQQCGQNEGCVKNLALNFEITRITMDERRQALKISRMKVGKEDGLTIKTFKYAGRLLISELKYLHNACKESSWSLEICHCYIDSQK